MSTDNANILRLAHAIGQTARDLEDEAASLSAVRREELVRNAEQLAIAARTPEENLYFQATQTAQNCAIRTAILMGIFEKIPHDGSAISATKIAAASEADERLVIRIMRACTSTHLFHEASPSHYIHNDFSTIFSIPANRDMFTQMYDFLGQGVYTMPHFLASIKYQNPSSYNNSAFQYGHHTNLGFWEYLKADPERARIFNSGMQSLATIGNLTNSAGPYPFEEQLKNEEIRTDDVTIVDIGGGRGQVLEAVKTTFPTLNGRMILQDVDDVIEDAKSHELPHYIEPMAVSFFEPQPVEGALIYHFRRIFHDWADEPSQIILRNTAHAMTSRSRILIADTIVPEIGARRHIALQDINMMSFGGMERTQLQWEALLSQAGLRLKKIWLREGNVLGVLEAVLPQ